MAIFSELLFKNLPAFMKSYFNLIFFICILTAVVFGQDPPPAEPPPPPRVVIKGDSDTPAPPPPEPPAPLIYSAPDKSKIVSYLSEKSGFKLDFPGKPEIVEKKIDAAQVTFYSVKLKGANEIAMISDFDFDVETKLEKTDIFDQVKQNYLAFENAELAYEKDIDHNGLKGKEFGVKLFLEFYKVRAFVKNGRVYELISTVTNWGILEKYNKQKAAEFENESERFFNSFKIEKPPAVVYSDLKTAGKIELFKSRSNIYEPSDAGFRIYFPAKPNIKKNRMETGFGQTDLYIHSAATSTAFYAVTHLDYPAAITDQTEIRYISDAQRDILIAKNHTLVSEKDISYKGKYGREYVLTSGGKTLVMRNFFVNQRFFRLIVMTNGIKGKMPPSMEEYNQQAVSRFLDSFEITKVSAAEFQENKMPADFGLKTENAVFYSDYFGFSMPVPENWTILTKEQSALFTAIGISLLDEEDTAKKLNTEKSIQNSEILFGAVKYGKTETEKISVLFIGAEKMALPRFLPEDVAEIYLRESLDKDEEAVGGVNKVRLGGIDFAYLETFDKKDKNRSRIYFANIHNLAFEITFTYHNENDLKEILKILNTIKFKK